MENLKVVNFLEKNGKFLLPNKEYSNIDIESALRSAPETLESVINQIPFYNPSKMLLISCFLGIFGVDRFLLGDGAKGILKLITFGGLGTWAIIDMISAKNRCRAFNCQRLLAALSNPESVAQMESMTDTAKRTAKIVAPEVKKLARSFKDVGDSFGRMD